MLPKLTLAFLGIAFWPLCSIGQEQSTDQQSSRENQAASELTTRRPPQPVTTADLEALAQRLEGLITRNQLHNADQMAKLRTDVDAVTTLQLEDRAMLEQLAQRDKDGRSYIRLDTSHEPTRLELRRAVSESTPPTGTVRIQNNMNNTQAISINGQQHEIIAGAYKDIDVNVGEFRVKLPGQPTQVRYVGLPDYTAEVIIRPRWVSPPPAPIVTYSAPLTYVMW